MSNHSQLLYLDSQRRQAAELSRELSKQEQVPHEQQSRLDPEIQKLRK